MQYEGTPVYPPESHQNNNAPKFIPIPLKLRHVIPSIQPIPQITHFNAPTSSQPAFKPFPIRILQEEFMEHTRRQPVSLELTKSESLADKMAKVRANLKTIANVAEPPTRTVLSNQESNFSANLLKIRHEKRTGVNKFENLQISSEADTVSKSIRCNDEHYETDKKGFKG